MGVFQVMTHDTKFYNSTQRREEPKFFPIPMTDLFLPDKYQQIDESKLMRSILFGILKKLDNNKQTNNWGWLTLIVNYFKDTYAINIKEKPSKKALYYDVALAQSLRFFKNIPNLKPLVNQLANFNLAETSRFAEIQECVDKKPHQPKSG